MTAVLHLRHCRPHHPSVHLHFYNNNNKNYYCYHNCRFERSRLGTRSRGNINVTFYLKKTHCTTSRTIVEKSVHYYYYYCIVLVFIFRLARTPPYTSAAVPRAAVVLMQEVVIIYCYDIDHRSTKTDVISFLQNYGIVLRNINITILPTELPKLE